MIEGKKYSRVKKWLIAFMIIGGFLLGANYAISILFADWGTPRTRVAEGLVLASSAKNLVVDNAVNGRSFNAGWAPIKPTENTQSISIDTETGAVTIVSTSVGGGAVMTLTPMSEGRPLVEGKKAEGIIFWRCTLVDQGTAFIEKIPVECRS